MLFNQIVGANVIKDDGSGYEKLVTITEADIAEWKVEGKPQTGRISLKELAERGIYQVKRAPGDKLGFISHEAFRKDPKANPVKTTSGKLEIHSQSLANLVKNCGWNEIAPIPKYNRVIEGYEDSFKDLKNKVKGEFPLQLYTIHYTRRTHSVFDNVTWLREAFPQELIMNPSDAEVRGIKTGDTVLVTSRHGKVLRQVFLTERMMPEVVTLGEGAWVMIDEATGIDLAGATNILNGAIPTGQGHSGWNSCNVQITKWTGKPLDADAKWPPRIPLKEA
jgi:anaerobic dimethyl sulfoxide reductase subunit A